MICTSLLIFAILCAGIQSILLAEEAMQLYDDLSAKGVICDGNLTEVGTKQISRRYGFSTHLKVVYEFTTPDGRLLHGEQVSDRILAAYLSIPTVGTPVKVLYANDKAFIVL